MIYIIITASIHNRFGLIDAARRRERYLTAITDTLLHVPSHMTPIIVENNGERETYLDHFEHAGKHVRVVYTNNNEQQYANKSTIEMLDIKETIRRCGISSSDMIIKITGRYRMMSSDFFMNVERDEQKYNAFVKFYNVHNKVFDDDDSVLGCFALRAIYFQLYPHRLMDSIPFGEKAFAKYINRTVRFKKIHQLDVECEFANTNERLIV
jgi:hypothetical protein